MGQLHDVSTRRRSSSRRIAIAARRRACESTPTFFVGDRALAGAFPVDTFRVAIDAALAKQKSRTALTRPTRRRMNLPLRVGYEGAALLARALAVVAPASGGKLLRSLRRTTRRARPLRARSCAGRARPLLWMHAPSVGEGLQARPVLELARARMPDAQLAYTYFSPSAERFAQSLDVDFRDVLPFDTTADARAALDALAPTALVFSKLDVWPTLAREASRRGVRLGLDQRDARARLVAPRRSRRARCCATRTRGSIVSAPSATTTPSGSSRSACRARASASPATRATIRCGPRAAARGSTRPLLAPLRGARPTLVAGSTWPADEQSSARRLARASASGIRTRG